MPPSKKTVPADPLNPPAVAPIPLDTTSELLFNYQVVGGVPYEYEIGQYEITAAQYCTFLNVVDPEGENPKQPWTKVKLWNRKNDPLANHFQGQILYVDHAEEGRHYVLADPLCSDKPMMFVKEFQYAHFVNSLANGGAVGEKQRVRKSPLGFDVKVTDRFYSFSPTIDVGSYALNDSNYAFLARQNIDGLFFLLRMSGSRRPILRVMKLVIKQTISTSLRPVTRLLFRCLPSRAGSNAWPSLRREKPRSNARQEGWLQIVNTRSLM